MEKKKIGCIYTGRSWKGDECGIMTEQEWLETEPRDFRPNTTWNTMALEEAINSADYKNHIMNLRVRDIII